MALVRAENVRSQLSPDSLSSNTTRARRSGSTISNRNGPTVMSVRSRGARRDARNACCRPPRDVTLNAQSWTRRWGYTAMPMAKYADPSAVYPLNHVRSYTFRSELAGCAIGSGV